MYAPFALDIVHLGNRNTVSGGIWAFEPTVNANFIGTQPLWLINVDQSGPQTTLLGNPIRLDGSSSASLIFQISDGGGSFEVEFKFASGGSFTATLSAGDWFGGPFPGTDDFDNGNPGAAGLNIDEGSVAAHVMVLVALAADGW